MSIEEDLESMREARQSACDDSMLLIEQALEPGAAPPPPEPSAVELSREAIARSRRLLRQTARSASAD